MRGERIAKVGRTTAKAFDEACDRRLERKPAQLNDSGKSNILEVLLSVFAEGAKPRTELFPFPGNEGADVELLVELWQSLQSASDVAKRLAAFDLERLAERAQQQRAELEAHRLRAAHEAFA